MLDKKEGKYYNIFNMLLSKESVRISSFNVDILAEGENTARKIVIENQLEPTNHDYLGKIITYTSCFLKKRE